jgi:hypothetical protein
VKISEVMLAVTGVVAVAAGGVGAEAAFRGPEGPRRPPARPAGAPADAAAHFGAFKNPDAAPVDADYRARVTNGLQEQNPDLDPATFRLLRRVATPDSGHIDFYAAAGAVTVCSITRHVVGTSATGGVGCGVALDEQRRPALHASAQKAKGDQFLVAALVPDDVTGLKLEFGDGTATDLAVENNAAVHLGKERPAALSYRYSDGSTVRDNVSLPDAPAS